MLSISSDLEKAFSKEWHNIKDRVFIAGGSIRDAILGRQAKDIDIFFRSQEDADYVVNLMKPERPSQDGEEENGIYYTLCGTQFAKTENTMCGLITTPNYSKYNAERFGNIYEFNATTVQFVTTVTGSPLEVISTFDQTINMVAWDIVGSKIITNEAFPISFDERQSRHIPESQISLAGIKNICFEKKGLYGMYEEEEFGTDRVEPEDPNEPYKAIVSMAKVLQRAVYVNNNAKRLPEKIEAFNEQIQFDVCPYNFTAVLSLYTKMLLGIKLDPELTKSLDRLVRDLENEDY